MKTIIGAAALAAVVGSTGIANAQTYPDKPIRLIIPYSVGGPLGTVANLLADNLGRELNANIVIEPRPGAGGAIGFEFVKNAPADGYTLMAGTISTASILPAIRDDLPFDTVEDFEAISHFVSGDNIIAVPGDSPIETIDDLIAFGQDGSGVKTCGSFGMGSTAHLGCQLFNSDYDTDFTVIHYTGAAPATAGIVGGETSFLYGTTSLIDFVADGSLRIIAVASDERLPDLPDVPTLNELGYPDLAIVSWYGLFAPAGTPGDVVATLEAAVTEFTQTDAWAQSLRSVRMSVSPDASSDTFEALIASELERWDPIARAAVAEQ